MPCKRKIVFESGDKSGDLTFIKEIPDMPFPSKKGRKRVRLVRFGEFKCVCGNVCNKPIFDVKKGDTTTCGCKKKPFTKYTSYDIYDFLYSKWNGIKRRCYTKTDKRYKNYGARGIVVSDEFLNSYLCFKEYVESLPNYEFIKRDNLSLDRIDNNGNYERGNLRWATAKQQANNRSNNKK